MTIEAAGADTWDGNLQRVAMRTWLERDSEIVATMVVQDGDVHGFTNLRFVGPHNARLVWLWIRHAAWRRAPMDVLWAADLAKLEAELHAEEA